MPNPPLTLAVLAVLGAALGGCATITRGTTEPITFISEPPGAAVTTTIGFNCPVTPCVLQIRRQDAFTATFDLPGYKRAQVAVTTVMAGGGTAGLVGNVLVGGIIGGVVDSTNGATLDHVPNPVQATLVPDRPAPAVSRRPPARQRPAPQPAAPADES